MEDKYKLLSEKKAQLNKKRPFPKDFVKNLEEWFNVELTYTSNAIEGNTLTRLETAQVIENGLTAKGKSLREHLEAINHAKAIEYIQSSDLKTRKQITEKLILEIHQLILTGIDDVNAGRYRTVSARIAGSRVILPNPAKVPQLMKDFLNWLQTTDENNIKVAADAHFKFVSIHPFTDGNGRTARLLMNIILGQTGFPPAVIKKEERIQYLESIEKGQLLGDLDDYYNIIYRAIDRSLDIYLKALEGKDRKIEETSFLRIGELAKITQENVPTIRYWTDEGLLEVVERTVKGYQLYDKKTAEIVKEIRKLQKEKRLTILEIREVLKKKNNDLGI